MSFKQKCHDLRLALREGNGVGQFRLINYRDMTYVWNTASDNIILKWRISDGGGVVAQYRESSHYRHILETAHNRVMPQFNLDRAAFASPYMGRRRSEVQERL